MAENQFVLAVHGGAYAIPDSILDDVRIGIKEAARAGTKILQAGGSAMDAVSASVCCMEDIASFNCGTGSVLTAEETIEMDAMIMDGKSQEVGAVACVSDVKHPVLAARAVMEKTNHCFMAGNCASKLAKSEGLEIVTQEELLKPVAKQRFQEYINFKNTVTDSFNVRKEHDTVGAVALDKNGNLASATSTGGITGKIPGRVGDTPIPGSGGWAQNDVGAISTTGHGECIMRVCLAHRVANNMKSGHGAQLASDEALQHMKDRVAGAGGLVSIDAAGRVGVSFTSERMTWSYVKNGMLHSGVLPGEDVIEDL